MDKKRLVSLIQQTEENRRYRAWRKRWHILELVRVPVPQANVFVLAKLAQVFRRCVG